MQDLMTKPSTKLSVILQLQAVGSIFSCCLQKIILARSMI